MRGHRRRHHHAPNAAGLSVRSLLSAIEYLCFGAIVFVAFLAIKRGLGWHAGPKRARSLGGGAGFGAEPGGGAGEAWEYPGAGEYFATGSGAEKPAPSGGPGGRIDDDERAIGLLMEQARKQAADRGATDLLEVMAMAQVGKGGRVG